MVNTSSSNKEEGVGAARPPHPPPHPHPASSTNITNNSNNNNMHMSAASRNSSEIELTESSNHSSGININSPPPSFNTLNLTLRHDTVTTDPKLIFKKSSSTTDTTALLMGRTTSSSVSGIGSGTGSGIGGANPNHSRSMQSFHSLPTGAGATGMPGVSTSTAVKDVNVDADADANANAVATTAFSFGLTPTSSDFDTAAAAASAAAATTEEEQLLIQKQQERSSGMYRGWKLTIPAPTFYSPREHYDSQCIEIYGGHTSILGKIDDDDDEEEEEDNSSNSADDGGIGNKTKDDGDSNNHNDNNYDGKKRKSQAQKTQGAADLGAGTGIMGEEFVVVPFIKSPNIIATTLSSTEPEDQYLAEPKSIARGNLILVSDPSQDTLNTSTSSGGESKEGNDNSGNNDSSKKNKKNKKKEKEEKNKKKNKKKKKRSRVMSIEKMSLLSPSDGIYDDGNHNDTTSAPNNYPTTDVSTAAAWTYAAPHITNWKVSSQNLLTVTYKKSIHCIPEYTNTNVCVDYMNRILKIGTCRKNSCSSEMNHAPRKRGSGLGGGGKESYSNRSTDTASTFASTKASVFSSNVEAEVFKETYTEKDIAGVKTFNIKITGFTGVCTAIQIHFQSKQCNYDEYDDDHPTSTSASASTGSQKQKKKKSNPNHRFHYNDDDTLSTREKELKKKLDIYLERSRENQSVPCGGSSVLEENGYGIENDYGLPLPPWDPRSNPYHSDTNNNYRGGYNDIGDGGSGYDEFYDIDGRRNFSGYNADDDDDDVFYGPILTFAVPNLSDKEQMDLSTSFPAQKNLMQDAVPLLWKVDFPPDPSIAVEALTVLDGVLDVHPDPLLNNDGDDSSSTSSYSSYSSCSKNECDARHPTNIYINGFQSWSFTGSVRQGEDQPKSAMPDFLSKAFNYGASVPPVAHTTLENSSAWENKTSKKTYNATAAAGQKRSCSRQSTILENLADDEDYYPFHEATHYKSDFYTCVSTSDIENVKSSTPSSMKRSFNQNSSTKLDEMGGTALVLGFLSQRKQFGLVTFDSELERVAMHASLGGVIASRSTGISTDWAYCQILPAHTYDEEPMVHYLNAVSSYNNSKPLQSHPPLTGWCSWYHYYENIDLSTLNANFKKMSRLKSTISQDLAIVDDGYITAWGDWASLKPKEFPKENGGMKALADNIRMNKMIPGLWMAPFACDKHSKIAKEHPDWIIQNDEGRAANSSNCGKFFYGLDATNPAVREFAFKSVRRAVQEWGYDCLKLDFLYAACLEGNGKYDLSMSRAETMYLALQTLRAAAGPDTFLIGCGCPIGPAIGYVDGMRISADTGPTWYPDFPLPWWDNATLPSLRAMIRNSTTRACLGHRWWHNDPDCILLGETTSLTDNEVISAASIVAMTGGMLLLSDDLSQLTSERIRVATRIFPVTGITAVVLDLHSTSVSGIPSLLRLWCTDSLSPDMSFNAVDLASRNSMRASFSPMRPWKNPFSRERNSIPVAKGLGTWSVVSFSNWLDVENIVSVPIISLLPPEITSEKKCDSDELNLGYHVFAFWSSKYIWVSNSKLDGHKTISKRLGPHETEIFHVKPVHASIPQYVGSELHFTCGYEVQSISTTAKSIELQFKNESKRSGFVYLYIPSFSRAIHVTMNRISVRPEIVTRTPQVIRGNITYGGQIIRVYLVMNGSSTDGNVSCQFR